MNGGSGATRVGIRRKVSFGFECSPESESDDNNDESKDIFCSNLGVDDGDEYEVELEMLDGITSFKLHLLSCFSLSFCCGGTVINEVVNRFVFLLLFNSFNVEIDIFGSCKGYFLMSLNG